MTADGGTSSDSKGWLIWALLEFDSISSVTRRCVLHVTRPGISRRFILSDSINVTITPLTLLRTQDVLI